MMTSTLITPSYDFSTNNAGYDRHQHVYISHATQYNPDNTLKQFSSAYGEQIYEKIVETLARQDEPCTSISTSTAPIEPSVLTLKLQSLDLLLTDILPHPENISHIIKPLSNVNVNPLKQKLKIQRQQDEAEEERRKQEEEDAADKEEEKNADGEIKTVAAEEKHQNNSVFAELIMNCTSSDANIRERCTRCLSKIASQRLGREWCVTAEILPRLAKLMLDYESAVRYNVIQILLYITDSQRGIQQIISYHILDIIIDKLIREQEMNVRNLCLRVLIPCLRLADGWAFAMGADVVNILSKMLPQMLKVGDEGKKGAAVRDHAAVLSHACQSITYIAVHNRGKDACVQAGLIPLLIKLLDSSDQSIREHASAAIMNITISQLGKIAAIECHAIPIIISHLEDASDCVSANSMQCLASIVEHPKSKTTSEICSQSTIAILRKAMLREDCSLVKTSAKTALDKILWEP